MKKIFGIKSININGTIINTFNVMIKSTEANAKLVKASGLDFNGYAGRNGDRIQITYTSLSHKDFNDKVNILGHLLRSVALNNLNTKYNRWVK